MNSCCALSEKNKRHFDVAYPINTHRQQLCFLYDTTLNTDVTKEVSTVAFRFGYISVPVTLLNRDFAPKQSGDARHEDVRMLYNYVCHLLKRLTHTSTTYTCILFIQM